MDDDAVLHFLAGLLRTGHRLHGINEMREMRDMRKKYLSTYFLHISQKGSRKRPNASFRSLSYLV